MSKYTFFNKIISDTKLVQHLVSQLYEDFGYRYAGPMEDIKEITARIKDKYKIEIKYTFVDFEDAEVISKYGLKKTTAIYGKHYASNYYFVLNKHTNFNDNRFLFLKALAYILFDWCEKEEELRITYETEANKKDQLAFDFAYEFLLPYWKYQNIKKQHQDLTDDKLCELVKHINKRLIELKRGK